MQTSKTPKPRLYMQTCSCYGCASFHKTVKPSADPHWLCDACLNRNCAHKRGPKADLEAQIDAILAEIDGQDGSGKPPSP